MKIKMIAVCRKDKIYKNNTAPIHIRFTLIDSFNTYLQTRYRCKHNGAVNLLCCLKNFMFYCLRNEWIVKNPFQNYKLKEEHNSSKDHLVKSEIDTLIAKEMPNRRLESVRDVFLFCCFTALAFTDADHLRREHISKDDKRQWWVHKPRENRRDECHPPFAPRHRDSAEV